jgi:hypothetical protein
MESLRGPDIDPESLPYLETIIPYTNECEVRRVLRRVFENATRQDSLRDYSVAVTGFPADNFVNDDERDEDDEQDYDNNPPILKKRKATYFKRSKVLILTMRGVLHESGSREFMDEVAFKVRRMNCQDEFANTGSADRDLITSKKQPDESAGPFDTGYITFAVESGVTESARALERDAKDWIEDETSHVLQVVTIKISRNILKITIKLWKRAPEDHMERSRPIRQAELDQEVELIAQDGRAIASDELRISFEQLFERPPRNGTSERDLVLSKRELGSIARKVWNQLGHKVSVA